mmetsp:Transcript_38567/g.71279  ORF Transcript_38567/g.71279 Transcript_38567/m.71279 type:complete len:141 (-) Transcript_38567:116-538(-)
MTERLWRLGMELTAIPGAGLFGHIEAFIWSAGLVRRRVSYPAHVRRTEMGGVLFAAKALWASIFAKEWNGILAGNMYGNNGFACLWRVWGWRLWVTQGRPSPFFGSLIFDWIVPMHIDRARHFCVIKHQSFHVNDECVSG